MCSDSRTTEEPAKSSQYESTEAFLDYDERLRRDVPQTLIPLQRLHRSRSARNFCLTAKDQLPRSRRFAPDNPTQTFQLSINTQYSNKNFLVLFLVWTRGHLLFQLLVIKH